MLRMGITIENATHAPMLLILLLLLLFLLLTASKQFHSQDWISNRSEIVPLHLLIKPVKLLIDSSLMMQPRRARSLLPHLSQTSSTTPMPAAAPSWPAISTSLVAQPLLVRHTLLSEEAPLGRSKSRRTCRMAGQHPCAWNVKQSKVQVLKVMMEH